jgi:hypothetical protein
LALDQIVTAIIDSTLRPRLAAIAEKPGVRKSAGLSVFQQTYDLSRSGLSRSGGLFGPSHHHGGR